MPLALRRAGCALVAVLITLVVAAPAGAVGSSVTVSAGSNGAKRMTYKIGPFNIIPGQNEIRNRIIDQKPGILGGDTPRADSPKDPQGFFGRFFETDILLLGCVTNLGAVPAGTKPRLCALPLQIDGACASPVRVVLVTD